MLEELGKFVMMHIRLLSKSRIILATYAENEEGQHDLRTLLKKKSDRKRPLFQKV
ncbi:hypothetical protein RR11_181 [Ruegeria sp. R11]|nr:hypothetical protein RR11_181 [Ruegeria sp. R11]